MEHPDTSAGGNSWGSNKVKLPTVTLQAGQYYLVQLVSQAAVGAVLPAPDTSGSVNMSGSAGKVSMVKSQVGLATVVNPNPVDQPCVFREKQR